MTLPYYASNVQLTNCTIAGNSATSGGGLLADIASVTAVNSIIWGDTGGEVSVNGGSVTIDFSTVQNGWAGTGNFITDPRFANPALGDYHLRLDSPCINSGTNDTTTYPLLPSDDIDGQPRPQGSVRDMGSDEWWMPSFVAGFLATTSVPGVGSVAKQDLVTYNAETGAWSLLFDGSAVGLSTSYVIDALAILPNGDLLISIDVGGTIPGLIGGPSGTSLDDSDIVRFAPSTPGVYTAGTWNFYFDGSDVGLTQNGEDIDALEVLTDGSLLISTTGSPSVPGLTGLAAQDLIKFTPTLLGSVTAGTWSYYFDGSDVTLAASSENVDAVALASHGSILLSTTGAFSVTGVSGADEDVLQFTPTRLEPPTTSGTYQMYFDLSSLARVYRTRALPSLFPE